jgi:type I restriction enzyme M protein
MNDPSHKLVQFIWEFAGLLRGSYRLQQYGRVMLPLTILRRLDCVLAPTKRAVLSRYALIKDNPNFKGEVLDSLLNSVAGQRFHNHSEFDFAKLKGDPDQVKQHLQSYINGFSSGVQDIFEWLAFTSEIDRLAGNNILYVVLSKFCDVDLRPEVVSNADMAVIFGELVRRFNEIVGEAVGDYFTPPEITQLMVKLLLTSDKEILTQVGIIKTLFDPTCGTGSMLAQSQHYVGQLNPQAKLYVYGQDFDQRSFATAASAMLMKGYEGEDAHIRFGDLFLNDQFKETKFDYFLAHPPFGVDWKRQQPRLLEESQKLGWQGRFGAGLPRVSDGSLLFLQHMISKFQPFQPSDQSQSGSRLAIVFSGSPMFIGSAGSGESEIRKWIITNDWLEAIIALPEQMFYNTGILTYIWIVTNRKVAERKGKIQLIDARSEQFYISLRRRLGDKRRKIGGYDKDQEENEPDQIAEIVKLYEDFKESPFSKLFYNEDFGYNRVPVERPLRLLYQMNVERKSRFFDAVPYLLDDVQAIDHELGRTERLDWSDFDNLLNQLLKKRGSRWKKSEHRLFREVFTEPHSDAKPVILEKRQYRDEPDARLWGWFLSVDTSWEERYEPDLKLRFFEKVFLHPESSSPLDSSDIHSLNEIRQHFNAQVLPHVTDAWADRANIRSAYEINFNRHFYTYVPTRLLDTINTDLQQSGGELLRLLSKVMSNE